MSYRNPFRTFDGQDRQGGQLIDQFIGNAYPAVREVSLHLAEIVYLAQNVSPMLATYRQLDSNVKVSLELIQKLRDEIVAHAGIDPAEVAQIRLDAQTASRSAVLAEQSATRVVNLITPLTARVVAIEGKLSITPPVTTPDPTPNPNPTPTPGVENSEDAVAVANVLHLASIAYSQTLFLRLQQGQTV